MIRECQTLEKLDEREDVLDDENARDEATDTWQS